MARSAIGRPGKNPGPGKTTMGGGGRVTGNLGRTTTGKGYGGNNHDVSKAFRAGVQGKAKLGPGGTQRP